MLTAIDTNVLIDVLEADPDFGEISREALIKASNEGALLACDVVWAELFTLYNDQADALREKLSQMNIVFSPLNQQAAETAARCWHAYRKQAGDRRRIAADFLVGAHAITQCDRLLSRDRGFYRTYFSSLNLFDPALPDLPRGP